MYHDQNIYQNNNEIQKSNFNTVKGYASVFNVVDNHQDKIIKGAFSEAIKFNSFDSNIKFLWQHKEDEPIGCIRNVIEDHYGLYVEAELLLSIKKAYEVNELIKANIINGLSIGYTPLEYHIDYQTNTRIISKINLWEISLVTFPANNLAILNEQKKDNYLFNNSDQQLYQLQSNINQLTSLLKN